MFSHWIINFVLTNIIIFSVIVFLYVLLTRKKEVSSKKTNANLDRFTLNEMTTYVKETLNDITNSNLYDLGLTEEEFLRRTKKRDQLKAALKSCNSGDIDDKTYVKEFIFDLLYKTYDLNDHNINLVIPFDQPDQLKAPNKFSIILYLFKKKYKYHALAKIIEKYNLDALKMIIEDGQTPSYIITAPEIHDIYKREVKNLSFEDKLSITVQKIYQDYKGFGEIDELRDMIIDGVSGGVSGSISPIHNIEDEINMHNRMVQSSPNHFNNIWIFYKGKTIHLSFLSFETEHELKRVCQNIYKYNNPGQLSETKGYMVNEMKDGSRVVVVRPPFAESWAFFVRKFDLSIMTLEKLIPDKNSHIPIHVIKYLMKGARTTAITGQPGAGKTSLLLAMIKYIDAFRPLRIQELIFELQARKIHPLRNILTLRETDSISGQEGLDLIKKTDGSVTILTEVATDPVAAWMIQAGQVGSEFTIFTHHAFTFKKLIKSLRNSLLKVGIFSNEKIAEEQVADVIQFNIHLIKDSSGKRYIERITECIPLDNDDPYGKNFDEINILEFQNGEYILVNPISETNQREMMAKLTELDKVEFQRFIEEYWGETDVS